jgi:2-C-methyl-D-erythritol 4-phosphate cytidylyltransferase
MRVAALVLGAGQGERLGHPLPKAFVPLAGRSLLAHAAEALARVPEIETIVPVLPAAALGDARAALGAVAANSKLAPAIAGGTERQDSVRAGLRALPPEVTLVAVHDAARALVRPAAVSRVVKAAQASGAALLAVPAADTIKRVVGGRVVETPPRSECWAAQTPQVFRREWLEQGLEKAAAEGFVATDCAQLVEALGVEVTIVEGDRDNLKITHPLDLLLAEQILRDRNPEA